jgi:hypothetical protein
MSVRFLGRRVYVAAVVVLACVRAQLAQVAEAPTPEPLAPARTLKRWRRWWQTGFIANALWGADKGRFVPPVSIERVPLSLLERFLGTASDKLKATLKWLSPLSTRSHRSGCVMAG